MRLGEIVRGSLIGFLLVAYLVIAGPGWQSLWEPCLTLLFAVLLWIPSIFAHEFGHALAGRTLGFRLNYVRVGRGGAFRPIGERVRIGSNPFAGGLTTFQPPEPPITRTGAVFLHSAGVLVNLALVFIALFLIPISSTVGWGMLFTNFCLVIFGFVPTRSSQIPGGRNDGANVWIAVFGKR
jgi:hypothetical protein